MTPASIISTVRHVVNDTDPVGFRNSDAELLRYVMDGLRECSMIAPQMFYATGDLECDPEDTEQGVSFADAQALIDVIRVKGGGAILPGDIAALSAFRPGWGQDTSGPAVNWFRYPGDPLRFYLYPKSPTGQIIEVKYVRSPVEVGLNDEITDLPSSMEPALVLYVVFRAESKDDEHVNAGRSAASYQQFVALLKPA